MMRLESNVTIRHPRLQSLPPCAPARTSSQNVRPRAHPPSRPSRRRGTLSSLKLVPHHIKSHLRQFWLFGTIPREIPATLSNDWTGGGSFSRRAGIIHRVVAGQEFLTFSTPPFDKLSDLTPPLLMGRWEDQIKRYIYAGVAWCNMRV
jgi:hypothetical protein